MNLIPAHFSFWSHWINPFKYKQYNWIDFTFFELRVEWDKVANDFEFSFGILGLGIYVCWFDKAKRNRFVAEMDQNLAATRDNHDIGTLDLEED